VSAPDLSIVLALALSTVALCAVSALAWYLWRSHQRDQHVAIEQTYLDLQQRQLTALQRDVKHLSLRLEQYEAQGEANLSVPENKIPQATPYNQAIEFAKQGVLAGEIAQQCGISRSEAELIVSLYRRPRTS
jgi:hypothetical protein